MGLQSGIKCSGKLNTSNFTRQRIPDRRGSIEKEQCVAALVLVCRMHNIVESEEECPEQSWWRINMKKIRQINGGCVREERS